MLIQAMSLGVSYALCFDMGWMVVAFGILQPHMTDFAAASPHEAITKL
jgi:hypothetical protein